MFFTGVYQRQLGDTTKEWSQELRFTSPQDRPFRYLTGVYWYRVEANAYPGNPISTKPLPTSQFGDAIGLPPFDPSAPDFAIGTAIFYTTFTPDGGIDPLGRRAQRKETNAWALFGAVDYDFTERLTGRAELRMSEETLDATGFWYAECDESDVEQAMAVCGDDIWDLRVPQSVDTDRGSARFRQVTGRLGLDFQFNDDWMIYGSVAAGEKPGSINLWCNGSGSRSVDVNIPDPFDPETIIAYELASRYRV